MGGCSPGRSAVYAAGSVSLAMLETLVHLEDRALLRHFVLFEITMDESLISPVELRTLPRHWRASPPQPATQRIGDEWLSAGKSAVLRVPSAVVPAEWNFLLNPTHRDFGKILLGPKRPASFDPRLAAPAKPGHAPSRR